MSKSTKVSKAQHDRCVAAVTRMLLSSEAVGSLLKQDEVGRNLQEGMVREEIRKSVAKDGGEVSQGATQSTQLQNKIKEAHKMKIPVPAIIAESAYWLREIFGFEVVHLKHSAKGAYALRNALPPLGDEFFEGLPEVFSEGGLEERKRRDDEKRLYVLMCAALLLLNFGVMSGLELRDSLKRCGLFEDDKADEKAQEVVDMLVKDMYLVRRKPESGVLDGRVEKNLEMEIILGPRFAAEFDGDDVFVFAEKVLGEEITDDRRRAIVDQRNPSTTADKSKVSYDVVKGVPPMSEAERADEDFVAPQRASQAAPPTEVQSQPPARQPVQRTLNFPQSQPSPSLRKRPVTRSQSGSSPVRKRGRRVVSDDSDSDSD